MNILKTTFKLGELKQELEDLSFHIFHLKTEHNIFYIEEELNQMEKYDTSVNDIRNLFKQSTVISEEWAMKKTEFDILKEEYGITDLEEEYERRNMYLQDGLKYLDSLYDKEFDSLANMLERFHL